MQDIPLKVGDIVRKRVVNKNITTNEIYASNGIIGVIIEVKSGKEDEYPSPTLLVSFETGCEWLWPTELSLLEI